MSSLNQLARGIKVCEKCRLHESRTHAVPGEGPADAKIVFIGEAPGKTEDQRGLPFQGAAGRFLRKELSNQQIPVEKIFITNCVKCRPPENRKPRSDELKTCKANWLQPQLSLLKPKIIVLLGQVAIQTLLNDEHSPLKDIHGVVQKHDDILYFPTYHPASALRYRPNAEIIQSDFAVLKSLL